MSLRTVLRSAMSAILSVAVVGSAAAQAPNPWRVVPTAEAPMPHVRPCPVVCTEAGYLQIDILSTFHGDYGFVPAGRPTIHFTPVPMPRAIVEVIGNFEFGIFEQAGTCCPVTLFRPAPIVWSRHVTPIQASEPAFTWTQFREVPPQSRHLLIERNECSTLEPIRPVQIIQSRHRTGHRAGHLDGPGGWWLDATPVPMPRCTTPEIVGEQQQIFILGQLGSEPRKRAGCAMQLAGCKSGDCSGPCSPAALGQEYGKLTGTWCREIEGAVISAAFSGVEMKLCMTQCDEGGTVCFIITADYAMTKEGLIHGVVTGVDVDVKRGPHASAGGLCAMPPAAITSELQKFVDSPFSFRTKSTSAGIMVSNLKLAAEGMDRSDVALVCGMYKPAANGKVPNPKPMKSTAAGASRCETLEYPPVAAYPYQPVPTTGAQPPVSLPVVPAGGMVPSSEPQSFAPPKPMNVPLGDFGVMAEVFGQMLDVRVPPKPAPLPTPTMRIPTPPQIDRPR
jgi:hypothetical protein